MYQLSEIAEQQVITAIGDFGNAPGTSFTQQMNLYFQPDYMIVRSITYSAVAGSTVNGYIINCDLVNADIGSFTIGQIITTDVTPANVINFTVQCISSPLIFKLSPGKVVSGNVTFSIRASDGGSHALTNGIVIHIEFVKLKKEK